MQGYIFILFFFFRFTDRQLLLAARPPPMLSSCHTFQVSLFSLSIWQNCHHPFQVSFITLFIVNTVIILFIVNTVITLSKYFSFHWQHCHHFFLLQNCHHPFQVLLFSLSTLSSPFPSITLFIVNTVIILFIVLTVITLSKYPPSLFSLA